MPVKDATQRFSPRVENYVRYRPGYPMEVVQLLKDQCGLTTDSVVTDIASGTGIFTRLLLETGCRVLGVEPNADMRRAGEEFLSAYPRFTSVAGSAESTTLADHSVDLSPRPRRPIGLTAKRRAENLFAFSGRGLGRIHLERKADQHQLPP